MQNFKDRQEEGLASSVVEFAYPTLCVDAQLVSVCAPWSSTHTWVDIMTPVSEGQSDDTSSSLGDSAYEILGDSTILTSDEEDRDDATDSASSVGAHGPDDVTSVAGTEQSDDSNGSGNQLDPPGITPAHSENVNAAESLDFSQQTITNPAPGEETAIEFEERSVTPVTEVSHTMRVFDEAETVKILQNSPTGSPSKTLLGTVRQTMSQDALALEEPMRIWYVGCATFKYDIIVKLATALAAPAVTDMGTRTMTVRQRSSRFSIVPVSPFGDGGAPEVELIDSLGLELVVDECTSAHDAVDGKGHPLNVQLNGTSWCSSRRGEGSGSGWVYEADPSRPLPHLGVILLRDVEDSAMQLTRLHSMAMMRRHGVPVMLIASSPRYARPTDWYHPMDWRCLHACLEAPATSSSPGRVLKRLPVDLITFLRIEVGQMNRNLACLTGMSTRRTATSAPRTHHRRIAADAADRDRCSWRTAGWTLHGHRFGPLTRQGRRGLLLLGLLLLLTLMGTGSTWVYRPFGSTKVPTAPHPHRPTVLSTTAPTKAPLTGTAATTRSSTASSTGPASRTMGRSLSTQPQSPNGLTVPFSSKKLGHLLGDPSLATLNQSDRFKLQIVGDCHLILRPPKKVSLMKRPPPLSVLVSRHGQAIAVELSKLFEGVYAVKLAREDAWGVVDVTVATTSKPIVEQRLTADFGTPWLKMAEWQRAANDMARRFQDGFSRAQLPWPPRMPLNFSSIVRPPARHPSPSRFSTLGLPNYTWSTVTRAAQQVSGAVQRRQAVLSAQLASLDDHVSDLMAVPRDHAARLAETFQQWTDQARETRIRMSKTFTVPRARKQAGRIWARVRRLRDGAARRRTLVGPGEADPSQGCRGRTTCSSRSLRRRWWR